MRRRIPYIIFLFLPFFAYGQDCCGPGGGGGASIFTAGDKEGVGYRLRNVRPYAYSTRHPGFTAGLETGVISDGTAANITSRLEYQGSWDAGSWKPSFLGSFDIYGGAFYSFFLDKPHSHQADLAGNIAWRFAPGENSRLVFRLDNEDLFVFFPDTVILAYAALDPSLTYSRALSFGDLSLSLGFPVLIKPEGSFNSYAVLGYEHPMGLSVSICPRLALVPDLLYSGTTLTLGFAWDRFFMKAAFVTNKDFSACDIRPYAEFTLGHIVLRAGAELGGLGGDDVSINPFVGAGYHF
ncbi:MAG: hypothetical protein LBP32_00800 [Spirochaetaceae bacterium]|jgi:hypothetical protein|nr:hypothetical protein [Spirochaetaceae bacterium]